MCVGLAPRERLIRSAAAGVGNQLVLLGARTGRDGIGGASVLASAELSEEDDSKRPTVQIGDPFEESKLRRVLPRAARARAARLAPGPRRGGAVVELVRDGLEGRGRARHRRVARAAARGRHGAVRDHDLGVAGADAVRGRAGAARRRARRCASAGTCARRRSARSPTREHLRVFDGDELVGDMPVERARGRRAALRPRARGAGRRRSTRTRPRGSQPGASPGDDAAGAARPRRNIASKRFVFEQYDSIVGSRTIRRPESADAAVLVLEPDGGSGALAVSIDGNGRRVACDPYTGAVEAVLECARNLACVGAEPLGLTNCLNFGNPEKPHIAWQLTRAVEGLRDACLALGVPVVGGNVSLYNEGGEGPIYPTPIVGMVGKLPEPAAVPRVGFAEEGHAIALVGMFEPALDGLGAGEAARPPGRARCRRSTCRRTPTRSCGCAPPSAAASCPPRTTSPRAGWPARWPSAASRAGWAHACGSTSGEAGALRRGPRRGYRGRPARRGRAARGRHRDRRGGRRRARDRGRAERAGQRAAGGLRGRDPGSARRVAPATA